MQDLDLLRYAREDLQTEGIQYYWPDADRHNIDTIIREWCAKWVAEQEGRA